MKTLIAFPGAAATVTCEMSPSHVGDIVSLARALSSDPVVGAYTSRKYIVAEREIRLGIVSPSMQGCGPCCEEAFQILTLKEST